MIRIMLLSTGNPSVIKCPGFLSKLLGKFDDTTFVIKNKNQYLEFMKSN